MNIGIFCSANEHINPAFFTLTSELGRWMAENGHTLVFGGCDMGLMECAARAVHEAGGKTIGIVPSKVEERGRVSSFVDQCVRCNNLSDRKDLLLEYSDVLIALPGGIGTLDEVFTVAASATIGYHSKRVIIYNMEGFWNDLKTMMDGLELRGMIRGRYHDFVTIVDHHDQLVSILNRSLEV